MDSKGYDSAFLTGAPLDPKAIGPEDIHDKMRAFRDAMEMLRRLYATLGQ